MAHCTAEPVLLCCFGNTIVNPKAGRSAAATDGSQYRICLDTAVGCLYRIGSGEGGRLMASNQTIAFLVLRARHE
jgi:hypothetical protein